MTKERQKQNWTIYDKECPYCGEVFATYRKDQRFCSISHAMKHRCRDSHVSLTCANPACGKRFTQTAGVLAATEKSSKDTLHYCSKGCAGWAATKGLPRKSGRWIGKNGYVLVHPHLLGDRACELAEQMRGATRAKHIYEHRLVMAVHLDRPLTRHELVHHINGVKTDNRIENLQLCRRGDHGRLHADVYAELRELRRVINEQSQTIASLVAALEKTSQDDVQLRLVHTA